jgi:hypothetical protein
MSGHRVVTVQPEAVDFAAAGILRMEASLRYEDVANQLEFSDVFTFTGANDRRHFEFDYVSPTRPSYQCTTRVVFTSGLVRNRDLGLISNDVVVIPAT